MALPRQLCASRAGLMGGYGRRALWRLDIGICFGQRPGISGRGVADQHDCRPGRQRLALVRALMMRLRVLLLDEPTAALDVASVAAVRAHAERSRGVVGSPMMRSKPSAWRINCLWLNPVWSERRRPSG